MARINSDQNEFQSLTSSTFKAILAGIHPVPAKLTNPIGNCTDQ